MFIELISTYKVGSKKQQQANALNSKPWLCLLYTDTYSLTVVYL